MERRCRTSRNAADTSLPNPQYTPWTTFAISLCAGLSTSTIARSIQAQARYQQSDGAKAWTRSVQSPLLPRTSSRRWLVWLSPASSATMGSGTTTFAGTRMRSAPCVSGSGRPSMSSSASIHSISGQLTSLIRSPILRPGLRAAHGREQDRALHAPPIRAS